MPVSDAHSLHGSHGDVLTVISNGMVGLLKEYYRRGPTQAKTYYQEDLVVCLLRGGFTRVEQTLLDGGRRHAVIQQRREFQEARSERFKAVIEHATGRQVIGFMSGNQHSRDMICEVFALSLDKPVHHGRLAAGALQAVASRPSDAVGARRVGASSLGDARSTSSSTRSAPMRASSQLSAARPRTMISLPPAFRMRRQRPSAAVCPSNR